MAEQGSAERHARAAASLDSQGQRRVLTALCYDLVGSTDLLGQLDIEDFQDLIASFQGMARQAITACSGVVTVEAGDGGVALFPAEIDPKDAASLAIRAGLDVVDRCRRLGAEKGRDLHVRVGIATSMTLMLRAAMEPTHDSVTGPAFAMATRLQALAQPDTVVVSDETRRLARRSHAFSFYGSHAIKGFAQPERVWRALSHKRGVDRFFAFGRLGGPMVDRGEEIATIERRWAEVLEGRGRVVIVEGEAGIGKSRILHEVRRRTRMRRGRLLLFQCLPGDTRSALHPLLQNVKGGVDASLSRAAVATVFADHDVSQADVVDVFSLLLGVEEAPAELKDADAETIRQKARWAARRALEEISAAGPLVLLVEDVHWIDETSKRLLTDLAEFVPHCPVLVIATARTGSGEWLAASGRDRMILGPLDTADTQAAIASMWPPNRPAATPELRELVERVTGGVPLLIEEVCHWMADNASGTTDRLTLAASPGHASVFETVLNARLEPNAVLREIAAAAAVAGSRFTDKLLHEMQPEIETDAVAAALERLADIGFVTRVRQSAEMIFGFRHALIQETLYNSLLRKHRQSLHKRLFIAVQANRSMAGWLGTAALADHAERGGLLEEAIEHLVVAGSESSSRSALPEARQLLEHALELCKHVTDGSRQDMLRLSAMVALGPILTAAEGPNSLPARKLYEDGVAIARRRPVSERAKWFPIYWGWWFTDTVMDGERAQALLSDVREVEDPEVQLQARHCVWAIDFNLGRHSDCIAAVEAGLPLYEPNLGRKNATLFGGHDAKVCGLAHRGLSLWFEGKASSALRSMSEARRWAQETGHASSLTHAYINDAMLHCYRRDFDTLRTVIADIRQLTARHNLPALSVAAQIFEGWCDGVAGNLQRGRDQMREALGLHGEYQTPEDEPVYCGMLAELLGRTEELDEALVLLRSATLQAESGGSRYWLAELHRRRAHLLWKKGAAATGVVDALEQSLAIAAEQKAVPILLAAHRDLGASGLSPTLADVYRSRIDKATAAIEPGAPLVVNAEVEPWQHR